MILTISTTHQPATDLGFLLHKHPEKVQRFDTAYGNAHVFYPEADDVRCTAALLFDVDPIALTRGVKRGKRQSPDLALAQYVNDRSYAASSLLAVALGSVFRTAMQGRCVARPELPTQALPLEIDVPALPARGGKEMVRRLFEPLGWQVAVTPIPLDPRFPAWGDSRYVHLTLTGTIILAEALRQLYVLLPVLDDAKHYWVAPDEVDKLLRAGEGWLSTHPNRALIADRYLARRRALTRTALDRLAEIDDAEPESVDDTVDDDSETADEPAPAPEAGTEAVTGFDSGTGGSEHANVPLSTHRREAILAELRAAGAERVLDLGCGDGKLVAALVKEPRYREIVGVDVSTHALVIAERRLRPGRMTERQRERVRLIQGALTYTDQRLVGYDAAVLSEVIEHLDEPRLPALEYAVLGTARPATVVITTPNVEYNVRYAPDEPGGPGLPIGAMRHDDHRFEWDRATFRAWAERAASTYGYSARFEPVGEVDPVVGPPTQMVVLSRSDTTAAASSHPGPTTAPSTTARVTTTAAPTTDGDEHTGIPA